MKKQFSVIGAAVVLLSLMIHLSSCEKDEGKEPSISFKSGTGYTSADATAASGSAILLGITAAKTEDKDVLKSFNIQHTVDAGTAVNDTTINPLATADENSFSKDFTVYPAGTAGQKVKYTASVTNRDGITGKVSLTITIQ